MTHKSNRWNRIQTLFDEALGKDADKRSEFLNQACGDDRQLLAEVESLLAHFPSAEGELGSSPFLGSVDNESAERSPTILEDAIPGFQILEELHRGGQGIIYLATQHSTKRQVAVKVMLEGPFASPASKRRFEREVELASSLSHPGIVPVFDSGVAHGQYYFAMEYIRGLHLDEYVRGKALPTRRVLELFVDVCAAVDLHELFDQAIEGVGDGCETMILDFRSNLGGGYDRDAVLGRFVPEGETWGGERSAGPRPFTGQLVVLIDPNTISAGETIVGELKEEGRAYLIGPGATHGASGSKKVVPAPSGLLSVRFVVRSNKQRFNGGKGVEGLGIEPHEIVEYDPEQIAEGVDPCIARALEIAKEGIPKKAVTYVPPAYR